MNQLIHLLEGEANATTSIAQPKDISVAVSERFKDLFPSIPIMISTVIAFTIIFIVLFFLLYRPTKRMMKNRHDYIQSNINESIRAKEESLAKLDQAQQKLLDSHQQSSIIIANAKSKAEEILASYKTKAINDANRLLEDANIDIEKKKADFRDRSKEIIANIAVDIARQILGKEITAKTQTEIVNQFLDDDTPLGDL